jgi:lycopene beta-cyclase
VLLLEAASRPGGNHTWSFHHGDLTPEQHDWLAPLVAYRWQGYNVRFPALTRTLPGGYCTITSERFADVLKRDLGDRLQTRAAVASLTPTSITLEDGTHLEAAAVIDGRGYQHDSHLQTGSQSFLGQQWRLKQPHGLTRPILMDATVDQREGYRFVYTLPFSATELLIEDTHYIDDACLDSRAARQHITDYARQQGWQLDALVREEQGHLPIMLSGDIDGFWQSRQGQPCCGLRAGLFHATTGYSLPHAVALAEIIAACGAFDAESLSWLIHRYALRQWRNQRFFRILNRMLFLAGDAESRWRVMQRFYALNEGLIERFYAGQLTPGDKARILAGKPPVPVGEAMLAILQLTPRLRAFHHD